MSVGRNIHRSHLLDDKRNVRGWFGSWCGVKYDRNSRFSAVFSALHIRSLEANCEITMKDMKALHINSEYRTDVTFIDLILVLPNLLFCSLMGMDCTVPRCQHHIHDSENDKATPLSSFMFCPRPLDLKLQKWIASGRNVFYLCWPLGQKSFGPLSSCRYHSKLSKAFFECNLTIFVDAILFCLFRKSMIFIPMGSVSPVAWNDLRTQHDMSFKQLCNFQRRGQVDLRKTGFFISKKEHGMKKAEAQWGLWNVLDNSCCW